MIFIAPYYIFIFFKSKRGVFKGPKFKQLNKITMFIGGKYVNKINMLTKDRQHRQEKGMSGKAQISFSIYLFQSSYFSTEKTTKPLFQYVNSEY